MKVLEINTRKSMIMRVHSYYTLDWRNWVQSLIHSHLILNYHSSEGASRRKLQITPANLRPFFFLKNHFPAVDLNIPEVTMRFSMYLLSTWFSDFSLEFSSLTELTRWERSWRVFWSSRMWEISSSFSPLLELSIGGGVLAISDFLREGRSAIFLASCDSER